MSGSTKERFDAIVIGAGPAGEVAASRLNNHGLRTALVERGRAPTREEQARRTAD